MAKDSFTSYFRAILRTYAMLFFSQHLGFAGVLLLVSFAHPTAGVAGLAAAGLAVAGARLAGFNRAWTDAGAYSFNALLTGLALASFYPPGWALAGLVVVGAGVALLLSVALGGWLGGRGLPYLSLPFVGTTWLLLLGGAPLLHLPAGEASVYWLNDAYALGGPRLVALARWVGDWPWPPLLATYLRALGSVLFQDNAAAGLLVALGLLWHSRIAFTLSGLAFGLAVGLAWLNGTGPASFGDYNLGANYIIAAIAVGSVFVIPSAASYGWALASVPVTVLALAAISAALAGLGLPALSLPYCLTALLFLYVLLLRERPGRSLVLTPIQRYSPERNLYAYTTDRERLAHQGDVALTLPFLGTWTCTQGYADGSGPTHLGDWGAALDFAIADADGRTYQGLGLSLSDYYAYDKPVLAPADGVVEEVIQHLEDNAIGEVNLAQNWGNTVVIRHAPGLFTQLSHLRAHSVPVQAGDYVRRGDIIGTCGNSGRSPEPHLHFQAQATPYVGSRTLAWPLAWFVAAGETTGATEASASISDVSVALSDALDPLSGALVAAVEPVRKPAKTPALPQLRHFAVPVAGETVRPPTFDRTLSQALRLPPGYALDVRDAAVPGAPAQRWEVFTDAYNLRYLRCLRTGAVLYFGGDDSVFYCTAFYGDESSWLYLLYQAAYRVPLALLPGHATHDELPLSVVRQPALAWAQDVLAPFWRFVRPVFFLEEATPAAGRAVVLRSRVAVAGLGRQRELQAAELTFRDGQLARLRVRRGGHETVLTCSLPAA